MAPKLALYAINDTFIPCLPRFCLDLIFCHSPQPHNLGNRFILLLQYIYSFLHHEIKHMLNKIKKQHTWQHILFSNFYYIHFLILNDQDFGHVTVPGPGHVTIRGWISWDNKWFLYWEPSKHITISSHLCKVLSSCFDMLLVQFPSNLNKGWNPFVKPATRWSRRHASAMHMVWQTAHSNFWEYSVWCVIYIPVCIDDLSTRLENCCKLSVDKVMDNGKYWYAIFMILLVWTVPKEQGVSLKITQLMWHKFTVDENVDQ